MRTTPRPAEQDGAAEQQASETAGSAKETPAPVSPHAFTPRGRTSGSWTPCA